MIIGEEITLGETAKAWSIISFVVAWGLLKGKGWAWTVTIILSVISIVMGIISLVAGNFGSIINIIIGGIIIGGIIIYYLYRPHVKAYFGKHVTGLRDTAA